MNELQEAIYFLKNIKFNSIDWENTLFKNKYLFRLAYRFKEVNTIAPDAWELYFNSYINVLEHML